MWGLHVCKCATSTDHTFANYITSEKPLYIEDLNVHYTITITYLCFINAKSAHFKLYKCVAAVVVGVGVGVSAGVGAGGGGLVSEPRTPNHITRTSDFEP